MMTTPGPLDRALIAYYADLDAMLQLAAPEAGVKP
jgi:hypothetical protein